MIATVTLSTTTLVASMGATGRNLTLDSLAGIVAGQTFLYIDKELVKVEQVQPRGVDKVVLVQRGVDGTASTAHANGATVTIGLGHQFYMNDPMGTPPNPIAVYPYINVVNGTKWTAIGDDLGPQATARVWAQITTDYGFGSMGVRTVTVTVPS